MTDPSQYDDSTNSSTSSMSFRWLGKCGNCMYWDQIKERPYVGQCRRYPPIAAAGVVGQPITKAGQSCGEFFPRVRGPEESEYEPDT
mgnify:CR=1 FL=1